MATVKNYGIDVTLTYDSPDAPKPGAVHMRVLASTEEDWSGWFDTEEEALAAARKRRADIRERLGR